MKKWIIDIRSQMAILLFASVISNSCTKLDEHVYSDIPADEFGRNEDEVEAFVGSIYTTLKLHGVDYDTYLIMDGLSADMIAMPDYQGSNGSVTIYREAMQHTWGTSFKEFDVNYFEPFFDVALCNEIFFQIEKNQFIRADLKKQLLAEIRGVRAFWYYTLIDHYGNVPIVTNSKVQQQPATNTRSEVFTFIVNELNEIKDELRDDVATQESYGKMTKGAAYTLLAKMYLNAEIWNAGSGPKWEECISACNAVLQMPYVLEPWKNNFIPTNHNSREAIFSVAFRGENDERRQNYTALATLHFLDPIALGLNCNPWNAVAAHPQYVKGFDTADLRYRGSFLIGTMRDGNGEILVTSEGRPLNHTVDFVMNDLDAHGWGWIHQEEGARIAKWEYEKGLSRTMENDFHIFRLADVYLMKAEALLRSGGSVSEATELVNAIRERGLPDKLYSNVTLDDIYLERRFEFAWEGFTRQDMIRFGTFLNARPPFKPYVSDAKYLLYPVPQRAIDANNNLKQNPGY